MKEQGDYVMKKLSKKKIIVILIALLTAVCGIVFGTIAVIENSRLNKAYVSEYIQEYDAKGHIIDPILFSADSSFNFDSDFDAEIVFTDVGEYDWCITVSNKKFLIVKSKTVSVKYIIKDTTKPVFDENIPDEIEVYKDCEIENIEEIFKATDLAPVTISIDKENVDYSTVGEYTTNVYAIDKNDNVTNKEVKIKVLEPTVELNKTSFNMTVGATETIAATVKGKDQTVEWSSSDDGIATVDDGTISAKKAGIVTITAKANGVEATCQITVKAKASTSSNKGGSSKPSNNGSSSKPSSNSNNGGSSSSSSGSSSSSSNTTAHNHSGDTGNCGKWFNSEADLYNYFRQWAIQHSFSGYYNGWQCSCGQWTADFISY